MVWLRVPELADIQEYLESQALLFIGELNSKVKPNYRGSETDIISWSVLAKKSYCKGWAVKRKHWCQI